LLYRERFGLSAAQLDDPAELAGFQYWLAAEGLRQEVSQRNQ